MQLIFLVRLFESTWLQVVLEEETSSSSSSGKQLSPDSIFVRCAVNVLRTVEIMKKTSTEYRMQNMIAFV